MNKGVEVITIKMDSNLLRQAEEAFSVMVLRWSRPFSCFLGGAWTIRL